MELRHLSGFVAVAEELSFGRAASRLHVSQPAVSRLIRQLETDLGVSLFDRSTHHVELTVSGRAFLKEARAVLGQVEVAVSAARHAPRAEFSTLRVGHTECTEELVPAVLRRLRQDLPALRLDVRQVDRRSQARALQAEAVDVVMRRSPMEEAGLESEVVGREPMVIALPKDHGLGDADTVSLASLVTAPFVVLPGSPSHERLVTLCDRLGFRPKVAEEASSLASLSVLVASGVGVAAVPASVSSRFNAGGVVYRRLGAPGATLTVLVGWRRAEQSAAVWGFLRAARAMDAPAVRALTAAVNGTTGSTPLTHVAAG